jgi:hypothetical protein
MKKIHLKISDSQIHFFVDKNDELVQVVINDESIKDKEILGLFKTDDFIDLFKKSKDKANIIADEVLETAMSGLKAALGEPAKYLLSEVDYPINELTLDYIKTIVYEEDYNKYFTNKNSVDENLFAYAEARNIKDEVLLKKLKKG